VGSSCRVGRGLAWFLSADVGREANQDGASAVRLLPTFGIMRRVRRRTRALGVVVDRVLAERA